MTHLRYSGAGPEIQRDALFQIVRESPKLMQAFTLARSMDLPDWWIVSGAIYNQVWNSLTGRADMYSVKDIAVFYFDPDTGYEAEDKVIKKAGDIFTNDPPAEFRNQARVHIWYEDHFGMPYTPLANSKEAIDRFACLTHCVGMRLTEADDFELYAPHGLDDIFSFRVTPNTARNNKETHEAKGKRQKEAWPELTIVPWPQ